jgi:hypothetical protein
VFAAPGRHSASRWEGFSAEESASFLKKRSKKLLLMGRGRKTSTA